MTFLALALSMPGQRLVIDMFAGMWCDGVHGPINPFVTVTHLQGQFSGDT